MGKTKKGICFLLAVLILTQGTVAYASTISDLKKKNEQDKEILEGITSQIEDLSGEKDSIVDEMGAKQAAITDLLTSIEILDEEIKTIQEEIVICKDELDKAIAEEQRQKEAMMTRIKYIYEEGNESLLSLILSATGLSQLLNRADYVENIYSYDKDMLESYQEARLEVEELKSKLEEEESELEATLAECEEEKQGLEIELQELKQLSSEYDTLISKARQQAAVYKKQIEQQNAKIKKLEAEEAAKKAAAEKTAAGKATVDKASIMACNGSAKGKEIAIYACTFVGNPYVLGGTSLTNGADCSGFIQSVYKNYSYSIPRTSYQQRSAGVEVAYADAEPGDIICYAGHVALYLGNGRIVHASSVKTGIKLGVATYRPILSVRRIVK